MGGYWDVEEQVQVDANVDVIVIVWLSQTRPVSQIHNPHALSQSPFICSPPLLPLSER